MTWGEFKRQVEALGVRDDHRINYIDFADCLDARVTAYFNAGGWGIYEENLKRMFDS